MQSGLLGLGLKQLTSALNITTGAPVLYNPIVSTLFNVDTFDPPLANQFSLTLSRDDSATGNGGVVTFGGIPDLEDPAINGSSTPTSASWQYTNSISTDQFYFYSILVDGFVVGSDTYDPGFQIIIDSGANSFQVPEDTANLINSYWSPPMEPNFTISCDAVLEVPIGVAIGGETYYIESRDLMAPWEGSCVSLVSSGAEDLFLVGGPLLKNVVALFDFDYQNIS